MPASNRHRHTRPASTTIRGLLLGLALAAPLTAGSETGGKPGVDIEAVKNEAVELISRLHRLEQQLLYPAHTQLAVFVSVAENSPAKPYAVSLAIDNSEVASHVYTESEADALRAGGIQRLYTGNLLMGKHKLVVSFRQRLNDGKVRKHEAEYTFTKQANAEFIEVIVNSRAPHLTVNSRG